MIPIPNLSLSSSDQSQTAINPLAGLLGGGFSFSPQNSFGGRGNALESRPVLTTTQTPTIAPAPAATPYADSFGFGGGAGVTAPAASNLAPVLLVGVGALVLVAILLRK